MSSYDSNSKSKHSTPSNKRDEQKLKQSFPTSIIAHPEACEYASKLTKSIEIRNFAQNEIDALSGRCLVQLFEQDVERNHQSLIGKL